MRINKALMAALVVGGALSSTAAMSAPDDTAGYRANLVSCVMGRRTCQPGLLSQADLDYLNEDRTSRTGSRYMAERIATSRLEQPVEVKVSERQLDHWHARELKFAEYRSTLRALDDGWVPGVNYPYDQPRRAGQRPLDAW